VVDEVGPGASGVQAGDEVFAIVDLAELGGANAEYAVPAAWTPKPDALNWKQAERQRTSIPPHPRSTD
jgi:NADPH:quinone reductase-like Zn-dependent oxidoreductase